MEKNIVRVVKLYLTSRPRWLLLLNETYPGIMVVLAGVGILLSGQFKVFAFALIIAGAALIRFGIKGWRSPAGKNIVRVVKLHLNQRRRRMLLINDTYPGIMIALAGLSMLQSGQNEVFAFANIIAGATLIRFGIKEWRSAPGEETHGIQWLDVIGGVVTFLDAFAIYKPWKGFQPAWLYFLAGFVVIAKGLFASKIPSRRRLTIFEDGFAVSLTRFSSLKCKWSDIQTLTFEGPKIHLTEKNNVKRSFKLRGVENVSEAIDALTEAARNNMVDVTAGGN